MSRVTLGADDEAINAGAPPTRSLTFGDVTIEGDRPPSLLRTILPWVAGVVVLSAIWYFAADAAKKRRRRARRRRPFVGR